MLLAAPAHAVLGAGDTQVTFNLVNGGLSIQVSGTQIAGLGDKTPNGVTSTITGNLVSTSVTDTRNSLSGFTVSSNCTDFSDGSGHTIGKANVNVAVSAGNITAITVGGSSVSSPSSAGLFVPQPGGATCGSSASPLGQSVGGSVLTGLITSLGVVSANNVVTYTPSITVTVPPSTPDGTYTSVVTQTVV
jgi:hypothetical protein